MHNFLLVYNKSPDAQHEVEVDLGTHSRLMGAPFRAKYSMGPFTLYEFARHHPFYEGRDCYVKRGERHLCFVQGWIVSGAQLRFDAGVVDESMGRERQNIVGSYNLFRLGRNGSGRIFRDYSLLQPLYYGETEHCHVFSSRASSCGLVTNKGTLPYNTAAFVELITSDEKIGYQTIFENVVNLNYVFDIELSAGSSKLNRTRADIFYNESIARGLKNNPNKVFDEAYDRLRTATDAILRAAKEPSVLAEISGGFDSRVSFGLAARSKYRDAMLKAQTRGVCFDSNMLIGHLIAEHYQVPHELKFKKFSRLRHPFSRYGDHILTTEGMVSVHNCNTLYNKPIVTSHSVLLGGQESGLYKFGNNIRTPNTGFDSASIQSAKSQDVYNQIYQDFFSDTMARTGDLAQAGFYWKLTHTSYNWSSLLSSAYNMACFHPYFMQNDYLLMVCYNAGAQARHSNQIHYEMLKRIDEALVYDFPFDGRTFGPYAKLRRPPVSMLPHAKPVINRQSPHADLFRYNRKRMAEFLVNELHDETKELINYDAVRDDPYAFIDKHMQKVKPVASLLMCDYMLEQRSFLDNISGDVPEKYAKLEDDLNAMSCDETALTDSLQRRSFEFIAAMYDRPRSQAAYSGLQKLGLRARRPAAKARSALARVKSTTRWRLFALANRITTRLRRPKS